MLSFASCFRSFAVSKKGFSLIRRLRKESSTGLWKAFLCTRLIDFTRKAQHSFAKICFRVISMRWKFSLLLLLLFAAHGNAQVRVWEGTLDLPVYEEGAPDSNPSFDQF